MQKTKDKDQTIFKVPYSKEWNIVFKNKVGLSGDP